MSGLRSQQLDEKREDRCETGKKWDWMTTHQRVWRKGQKRSRITPKIFWLFLLIISQFSSVAQSCLTLCDPMEPPCPSPAPKVDSNSRPLSQWCHPTISSSVVPLHFFSWGWSWSLLPVQCHEPPSTVLQALCLSDQMPWIYLSLPLYSRKGFDLGHTWMV